LTVPYMPPGTLTRSPTLISSKAAILQRKNQSVCESTGVAGSRRKIEGELLERVGSKKKCRQMAVRRKLNSQRDRPKVDHCCWATSIDTQRFQEREKRQ
jgi:hypothetical protein